MRIGMVVAVLAVMWAQIAGADGLRLFSMNSLQDGRAWEAVGRLEIGGKAFCTGALIEEGLVLTAAHCLYDSQTGERVNVDDIQFMAGWRNGRAGAYRRVRRAVHHPAYSYMDKDDPSRIQNDVALLELQHPIRNTTIVPFATGTAPDIGQELGLVSYAHDRSEAPSLQQTCDLLARQRGALIMSCDVDFGASGSPVFRFDQGEPVIVSVVSGKANVAGRKVSLGTSLTEPLMLMRAQLAGKAAFQHVTSANSAPTSGSRFPNGAKFVRP
ncbi:trypsin-like serine peptidase [Pseudoprimorskyibacter insulae]|uniref:Glutamyl endopeptidase n=1 Tax=Pseudoprimorskyibacter insulae TaxID=1695997 RepID=A0A2R8AYZ0_9RHOB|nr:trypsin-like serine protease [Pseudoprimorskyibacter insulae]SPF81243.1 Glutamyl endopeptidase [Pseudoprimorskyibacter insulae]